MQEEKEMETTEMTETPEEGGQYSTPAEEAVFWLETLGGAALFIGAIAVAAVMIGRALGFGG